MDLREAWFVICKAATAKMFCEVDVPENVIVVEGFGCYKNDVVGLVNDILSAVGSNVRAISSGDEDRFVTNAVAVPIKNESGHDYALNEPILVAGDGRCIHDNNDMGGRIGFEELRPATDEEICKFLERVSKYGRFI